MMYMDERLPPPKRMEPRTYTIHKEASDKPTTSYGIPRMTIIQMLLQDFGLHNELVRGNINPVELLCPLPIHRHR